MVDQIRTTTLGTHRLSEWVSAIWLSQGGRDFEGQAAFALSHSSLITSTSDGYETRGSDNRGVPSRL